MDYIATARRIIDKAMQKTDDRSPLPDIAVIALLNYSKVDPEIIVIHTNQLCEDRAFVGHKFYKSWTGSRVAPANILLL